MTINGPAGNTRRIGKDFSVSFQRTLRIPDDGKTYPLPPGLGTFPIHRVADFANRVPAKWCERGGYFIPMYQREALWMSFHSGYEKPCAVKVGIGRINAITGKDWSENLSGKEQDYIVCPDQPWLDGINAGNDFIKQFVAMPLGMGYTVEGQVRGNEEFGGMQIVVYEPKPDKVFQTRKSPLFDDFIQYCDCSEMGLAAGGRMRQKIYADEYGADTWDQKNREVAYIHIVNSMMYREITCMEPPETPVSAKSYMQAGLPWFDLYDEHMQDVKASDILGKVKSVKEKDADKGFSAQQDDTSIDIPRTGVKKIWKCLK